MKPMTSLKVPTAIVSVFTVAVQQNNPVRVKNFHVDQTGSGAPAAPYPVGTNGKAAQA
jgi:hypothetical protein